MSNAKERASWRAQFKREIHREALKPPRKAQPKCEVCADNAHRRDPAGCPKCGLPHIPERESRAADFAFDRFDRRVV